MQLEINISVSTCRFQQFAMFNSTKCPTTIRGNVYTPLTDAVDKCYTVTKQIRSLKSQHSQFL